MPTVAPFDALAALLPRGGRRVEGVSDWSVGEHIEHCALAATSICAALASSGRPAPSAGLALRRRVILLTGWIPRGVAPAPAGVVPEGGPEPARLARCVEEARDALRAAAALDRQAWFRHFALGVMTRDAALAFIDVHTRHHLKIARAILAG